MCVEFTGPLCMLCLTGYSPCFLRQSLLLAWALQIQLGLLASWSQKSPCLHIPSSGIMGTHHHALGFSSSSSFFNMVSGDWTPNACAASPFLSYLPSLLIIFKSKNSVIFYVKYLNWWTLFNFYKKSSWRQKRIILGHIHNVAMASNQCVSLGERKGGELLGCHLYS